MTTIYLVYDEQIDEKMKHFHEPDENGIVSSGDENVSNVLVTLQPSFQLNYFPYLTKFKLG